MRITRELVRFIFEKNESRCLDNAEDREQILDDLFSPQSGAEEPLGPGLSVRYNKHGLVGFVFLNPDDHPTFIGVEELDPDWKQVLLRSIGHGK